MLYILQLELFFESRASTSFTTPAILILPSYASIKPQKHKYRSLAIFYSCEPKTSQKLV
jgi:hypothetical protein